MSGRLIIGIFTSTRREMSGSNPSSDGIFVIMIRESSLIMMVLLVVVVVVVAVVVPVFARSIIGIFTSTSREMSSSADVIDASVEIVDSKGDWTGKIGIVGTIIEESGV